jgi:hypothetical protein
MFDPFERMFEAQRILRERQASIVAVLTQTGIPFALFASNATYAWIESVDPSCVRQCRNIDLIANRHDRDAVMSALTCLQLSPESRDDYLLLRNKHTCHDRWFDRVYFAGEKLANSDVMIPTLYEIEIIKEVPVVLLPALVEFQLRRFKLDDKVDLRDLIDVGLIDQSWPAKLPPGLAERLQQILDTPEG